MPYTLLGVAWSLSLEVQFYLIAPALFAFCRRGWPARAALIILVAIGTLFAGKIIDIFSNAFLPAKAAYFLVGGLSFFAVTRPAQPWRAWLAVLAPSFILALLWWRGTGRLNEALLAPIVWCAVLVAVRFDHFRLLRAGLNSRPLQLLGRISYSTYLFHAPVIILLQAAIWRWVNPPSSRSLLLWTAAAAIPCTFFISWMCWRGIELPFQRLASRPAGGRYMTVLEVLQSTTAYFQKRAIESPRLNAEHLVAHSLGKKRIELYLEFERPLSEPELAPAPRTR